MHSSLILCLLLSSCFTCFALTQGQLARLVLQRRDKLENSPFHYINEKRIGSVAGEPIYPQVKFRLPPKEVAISHGFVPAYRPQYTGEAEQNALPRRRYLMDLSRLSEKIPVV